MALFSPDTSPFGSAYVRVARQAGERSGVIVTAAAVIDVAAIEAKNTDARPPLVEAASCIRTVLI